MENKNDIRFQKTHKKIQEAFKLLILQKNINNITVKEISEVANINRKTFYLHYNSIEDLLMELENEIAEQLLHALSKESSLVTSIQISDFCRVMNKMMNENYELHMRLIASDQCQFFVEKVQVIIIDRFLFEWENIANMTPSDLKLIAFGITNGIMSIYRMNYKQRLGLSLEQIAELVDKVINIHNLK